MWHINSFWKTFKMPVPQTEYRFHETRKWRIDYAWPDVKLAVEIEGGVYKKGKDGQRGGRHNRPQGFINDMEKYNLLQEVDWHLLRYLPNKVDYDQIARMYHKLKGGVSDE